MCIHCVYPYDDSPYLKHAVGCYAIQAEPTALEKKLLRKRQRQEQSDAVAGELGTHGLADSDDDEAADSKTASFKEKKRIRDAKPPMVSTNITKAVIKKGPKMSNASKEEGQRAARVVDGVGVAVSGEGGDGPDAEATQGETVESGQFDEKQGQKRKARRKKRKQKAGATAEDETISEIAMDLSRPASQRSADTVAAGQGTTNNTRTEEGEELGTKKQRRGFGKTRSATSTSGISSQPQDSGSFGTQGGTSRDRPRKKTRSKQKNIRKDKRAMDQRPSHLRLGDPEYAGRGLTEETRKVLGLPKDDSITSPPAGWSMAVKGKDKSSWVIDKNPDPTLLPVDKTASDDKGMGVDVGVAVEHRSKRGRSDFDVSRQSGKNAKKTSAERQRQDATRHDRAATISTSKKSKYRNLA